MGKRFKLISIDVIFLGINVLILYAMYSLIFWLFTNTTIITILLIITSLGFIKQSWKGLGDLMNHLSDKHI